MQKAEQTIRTTLGLEQTVIPANYAQNKTPWLLYVFTIFASFGGFLFGYDTGIISGAMIIIRQEYKLNTVWQEFVVASAIGSAAIFALVGGYLNNKVGRKPVVLLASIIYASGALCMACAEDRYLLVIGRMIIGSGIGLSSTTIPMYIAEASPTDIRGRLVAVNFVMQAGGQFVGEVISAIFNPTHHGWRYMVGLGGIPALVQFGAFIFMPESPRWLIQVNRSDRSREALTKLRGNPMCIDEEYETMQKNIIAEKQEMQAHGERYLITQIFQTPAVIRALIVGCGLQMFQQLSGINTVMYYSTTILTMAGVRSSKTTMWLTALTSFINFIFTFTGLYLVEKMGRRPLTIISLVGAIVSLGFLGVGFQLENDLSPPVTLLEHVPYSNCSQYRSCSTCNMDAGCGYCYIDLGSDGISNTSCLATSPNDWMSSTFGRCNQTGIEDRDLIWAYDFCPTQFYYLPMIGLTFYLIFYAPGMASMPWIINAEIYPVWARGAGNGASTFTYWIFNLVITISFLSMTDTIGAHGAFWVFLGFSVIGLLFLSVTLPETKGKTLEEIEGIFAQPWFGAKGTFNPYTKDSTRFNYMHMNINTDEPEAASRQRSHKRSRRGTGMNDSADSRALNRQLCTNRDFSTDDSLDDYLSDSSYSCSAQSSPTS